MAEFIKAIFSLLSDSQKKHVIPVLVAVFVVVDFIDKALAMVLSALGVAH